MNSPVHKSLEDVGVHKNRSVLQKVGDLGRGCGAVNQVHDAELLGCKKSGLNVLGVGGTVGVEDGYREKVVATATEANIALTAARVLDGSCRFIITCHLYLSVCRVHKNKSKITVPKGHEPVGIANTLHCLHGRQIPLPSTRKNPALQVQIVFCVEPVGQEL